MQLNFKIFGNPLNETIIILHGMFGTLDNWQSIAKSLEAQYCVYIVDLRNHGRSPHSDIFGYDIMCQDIVEFMGSQGLREAHLVGHSMGGKVAMEIALNYPELVQSLIVADIAPVTYKGHHEGVFEAMFALDPSKINNRKEAEDILKQFPIDWATQQFVLKNLNLNKDTLKYEWRMNLPVIYAHYEEILTFKERDAVYDGPTLFMRGEKSNYINENDLPAYQKYFPHAELVNIANAGHWLHADNPKDFVQAIMDFI